MSFPDELTAFRTYARLYPTACILLVDTYDTLNSGIPHAIQVFKEMRAEGIPLTFYGIRMGQRRPRLSLQRGEKKLLDAEGFTDAVISASNDLDETLITSLKNQGATINSWGVGTNLITSKDCPSFGGVYKLAAIMDKKTGTFIPKIKLSENEEKITKPGQQDHLPYLRKGQPQGHRGHYLSRGRDLQRGRTVTALRPGGNLEKDTPRSGTYTMRELPVQVVQGQASVSTTYPKVMDIQKYCKEELNTLWDETKRLVNPHEVHVDLSKPLWDMKHELLDKYHFE